MNKITFPSGHLTPMTLRLDDSRHQTWHRGGCWYNTGSTGSRRRRRDNGYRRITRQLRVARLRQEASLRVGTSLLEAKLALLDLAVVDANIVCSKIVLLVGRALVTDSSSAAALDAFGDLGAASFAHLALATVFAHRHTFAALARHLLILARHFHTLV